MNTLNTDTIDHVKREMRWAWEDAMDELSSNYTTIREWYQRKHLTARMWSEKTNAYPPNTELCMCA